MRVQRLEAFPGFDHDKRIGSELGLVGSAPFGVDDRPIFEAAFLLQHGGDVRLEQSENIIPTVPVWR